MRNIRADLQERLDEVVREREELQRRITALDPIEDAIKALIRREDETFLAGSLAPVGVHSAPVGVQSTPVAMPTAAVSIPSAPVEENFNDFSSKEVRSPVKQSQWGEFLSKNGSSR